MNLKYSPFFKTPRKIFKWFFMCYLSPDISAIYPLIIKLYPLPKLKSIPDIIDEIFEKKYLQHIF
jgi:hypothetical protein